MRYKECNIFEYALRYESVMDSQAGFFARLALRGRGAVLVFLTEEERPAGCVTGLCGTDDKGGLPVCAGERQRCYSADYGGQRRGGSAEADCGGGRNGAWKYDDPVSLLSAG